MQLPTSGHCNGTHAETELFTGSLIFALSLVVVAKRAGRPAFGCNFGQTNPTTASRRLPSFDLNPGSSGSRGGVILSAQLAAEKLPVNFLLCPKAGRIIAPGFVL
jgi:hypothetical protein